MAIDGLTKQQSDFIKKYLVKVGLFNRKRDKAYNDQLIAEYKALVDRISDLKSRADAVESPVLQKAMLARIATAKDIVARNKDLPDIPGAQSELDEVDGMLAFNRRAIRFKDKQDALAPNIANAAKLLRQQGGEIERLWAEARTMAETATTRTDENLMQQALQRLDAVQTLIRDGVAEQKIFEKLIGDPSQGAEVKAYVDTVAAKATMDAEAAQYHAVVQRLTEAFKPGLPAALSAITAQTDGVIAAVDKSDPAALTQAATQIKTKTGELEQAAVAPLADRQKWLDDLAAVNARFATLKAHSEAEEPLHVKPKIQIIQGDLNIANGQATNHQYAAASATIDGMVDACSEAIKLADAWKKMNTIRADREARMTKLQALTASTHATVAAAVDEAKAKFREANDALAADPIDIPTASAAFDGLAPMIEEATRLHFLFENSRAYIPELERLHTEYSDWQTGLNPADTPLDPDLGKFNQLIQDAKALFAVTGEGPKQRGQALERGMALSSAGYNFFNPALEARKNNVTTYYAAVVNHKTRLEKFEGRPGEEAVRGYIARLKTDATQAEGAAGRNEYHVGTALLDSSDGDEAAMLQQLADGATFFPKYKEVETLLDAINGKEDGDNPEASIAPDPNRVMAADLIEETRQLRNDAYGKGVSQKDWGTANSLIEEAKNRIQEAGRMLAAIKSVSTEEAKLGDTPDATKAAEALQPIRETAGTYADGAFAKRLELADGAITAATAQDADPDTIASQSAEAIRLCKEVIALAGKKKAYDAVQRTVSQKYKDDVETKKTPENGIDRQCETIEKLLEQAIELAKDEVEDFDGATAKVNEALDLVNAVPAMLVQKAALATKMQKVADQITKMEGADYVAGCGAEIDQLKKVESDYEDALKANDLSKMKTLADQGDALVAPLDALAERYKDFNAKYYAYWAKQKYDSVKDLAPDMDDATFKERKQVCDHYASFCDEVAQHNYQGAVKSYDPINWGTDTAIRVAGNWEDYKPVKADTRRVLDATKALATDTDAVNTQALTALEARFTAAVGWETERFDYVKAKTLMEGIRTDAQALAEPIAHYKAYKVQLDALEVELAKLEQLNTAGSVDPVLGRIRNKRDTAVSMADAGNRQQATVLLAAAVDEVQVALLDGGAINQFSEDTAKIGSDAAADDADLSALCDKARVQIAALIKSLDGVALMQPTLDLGDQISDAKASLPDGAETVKTTLADVATRLVELRREVGHNGQVLREIKAAEDLLTPLITSHEQSAYSAPEAQDLTGRLRTARHQIRADSSKKAEAMQTLEDVLKAYHPLKAATDAHRVYADLRDEVAPLIDAMEAHPSRFAIQDELILFRTNMSEAEEKARQKDHAAAMSLLRTTKALQAGALIKAKMAGNAVPTEDEIRAVLDAPGGDKAFDKIVEKLDPVTSREVLRVALTVRFGCTLEMIKTEETKDKHGTLITPLAMDEDRAADGKARKGPNMMALYKAMSLLPSADTLTNESLAGVVRVAKSDQASDHSPGNKKMTMREGEIANSLSYGVGLEYELEGVPPELAPKPGTEMRGFNWNTLHEVGHAVDDKLSFTTRRANELAGWQYQSSDVGPFAKVIATKFKYEENYVARLMLKDSDPPVPSNPDPDNIAPDEWERRRITVKAWLENTYSDRSPWQTTSSAKACEIDGRCYHESMPGYWVSYPISERSKGVTGYQFRSPLEWFSELYAAFHSGRLADAHPARAWLEKLKNPEEV